MTVIRIQWFILFFPSLISFNSAGQNAFGDILDTIILNDRQVFLFSDKKWAYLEDYYRILAYDTLFTKSWEVKEIHAYRNERDKFLKEIKVNLLENNSPFVFPLDTFKYLRGFTGYHTGIDLKADLGDTIRAAFDGRIRFAANIRNGYGNLVIIRHFNGLETYYSHLSKILVSINDDVKAGDVVGLIGSTGRATTHHLHFETRYRDKPFDPQKLLTCEETKLLSDSLLICNNLFGKDNSDSYVEVKEDGSAEVLYHTIIKGDTLYKIAKLYHTSIDKLCQLNNISTSTTLKIGKKLKVRP